MPARLASLPRTVMAHADTVAALLLGGTATSLVSLPFRQVSKQINDLHEGGYWIKKKTHYDQKIKAYSAYHSQVPVD